MKITGMSALGILAAMLVAGCGEMEPEDTLTREESLAMHAALVTATATAPEPGRTRSIELQCPQAGQARWVWSEFSEESGDTTQTVQFTRLILTGCVASRDGIRFTLDDNPHLRFLSRGVIAGSRKSNTTTLSGGVKWQLEERSGNCRVSLRWELDFVAKGSLCGYDVEVDILELLDLR